MSISGFLETGLSMGLLDTPLSETDWRPDALSLRLAGMSQRFSTGKSAISAFHWNSKDKFQPYRADARAKNRELSEHIEILPSSMFEDRKSPIKLRRRREPPMLKQAKERRKPEKSLAWLQFTQFYATAEANFRNKLRKNKLATRKPSKIHRNPLSVPPHSLEEKQPVPKATPQFHSKLAANERKLAKVASLKEEIRRSEDLKRSDSEAILQVKSVKYIKKSLLRLPICLKR